MSKKDYIISEETMALESKFDNFGNPITLVHEVDQSFYICKSAFDIVEDSCLYYHSTYDGVMENVKGILKDNRFLPVPISQMKGIYFISTKQTKSLNNIWLAYGHIQNIQQEPNDHTKVKLTNGHGIVIPMKLTKILVKKGRAARVKDVLYKRNTRKKSVMLKQRRMTQD